MYCSVLVIITDNRRTFHSYLGIAWVFILSIEADAELKEPTQKMD